MTHFQLMSSGSQTEIFSFSKPTLVIHPCTSSRLAGSGRFEWVCASEHSAWRFQTELFGSGLVAMLSTINSLVANNSLQPTVNPLRGLSAAELRRYTCK